MPTMPCGNRLPHPTPWKGKKLQGTKIRKFITHCVVFLPISKNVYSVCMYTTMNDFHLSVMHNFLHYHCVSVLVLCYTVAKS